MGKNVILFFKAPLIFLIFLWVVKHFIAVIYCKLNLTDSFREDLVGALKLIVLFTLIFYKASQSES